MRSDVDISTPLDQGFRQSKAWFWPWAVIGVAAVVVLALLEAPVWAFALGLVAWCVTGALWFRSDVAQASRAALDLTDRVSPPASRKVAADGETEMDPGQDSMAEQPAPGVEQNWRRWVSGWYWETDAQQHLQTLQPGSGQTDAVSVDWMLLSEYVSRRPVFLALWTAGSGNAANPEDEAVLGRNSISALDSASDAGAQNDLGRLAYCLDQQSGWDAPLELPWPEGLSGVAPPDGGQGWRCMLFGEARRDTRGRFLGLRGVMRWVAPVVMPAQGPDDATGRAHAGANPPDAPPAPSAQDTQMREAEQEVLRYALSHDLRAPLRVVEGFTRIVKEDYGRALDKLGNDHLERVLTAAARMNGMIDAILAQAQLAAEPLQRVAIDLSAMAREIGAEQMAAAPGALPNSARLVVADGLHIDADPLLVRRVLENLISNALKYSGKVESPCVEVGVMPATNPAVFFVRDNGAGFDMQHADKLFGMFQRLHSTKDFPGTGVGLAGVHNIVRRHGGRIWAEAKPGEGACFYFTLMGAVEAQQRAGRG